MSELISERMARLWYKNILKKNRRLTFESFYSDLLYLGKTYDTEMTKKLLRVRLLMPRSKNSHILTEVRFTQKPKQLLRVASYNTKTQKGMSCRRAHFYGTDSYPPCLGNGHRAIYAAIRQGRYVDALEVIKTIFNTSGHAQ